MLLQVHKASSYGHMAYDHDGSFTYESHAVPVCANASWRRDVQMQEHEIEDETVQDDHQPLRQALSGVMKCLPPVWQP